MKTSKAIAQLICALVCLAAFASPGRAQTSAERLLVPNANFEEDSNGDQWPDGWPKAKEGVSWEQENGNHFIRLTSSKPGSMVMLYREVPIPEGVRAIEIDWRQRVSGLKVGKQPWFDARILLEFMNAAREKVLPEPPVPYARKDTNGWEEKRLYFPVPEGATILKFMPALFQVRSGAFDLDDVVIKAVDAAPASEAAEAVKARRAKAAAALQSAGSLIPNGGFEVDANGDGWPDTWERPKSGSTWENENGNRFLRISAPAPDQLVILYQSYDIPAGIKALELTWSERVTGLKMGRLPWFDARILFEFKDAAGKTLPDKPAPADTRKDTVGWEERSVQFLVPPDAVSLALMPALFRAEAGTFDLDNISLKPVDPAKLLQARREREAAEVARYVPHEEPDKSKWPKMLKVAGNHLQDSEGKDVWLQGVNTRGLESVPQDLQVRKSVVVAIEDWKANCVRLPVNDEFWFGRSPSQNDSGSGYRKEIDQIITLAANRGAYIVLDLHRFRAPRQEHAAFWKDAASRYKDHPAVLFDVFNEPHDISWEEWKNGGLIGKREGADESAFLSEEEKARNQEFQSVGMQGLVDAARSTGAKNIIVAGGNGWSNDLSGIAQGYALDDKGGNGIMYSWHTYNWHKGWAEKVLAAAAIYPVFLGEVGADIKKMDFIPAADQEDPYTFIPDILGFIQKYKINWTGWSFDPDATPVMISDWNYTPTPFWGAFAKEALAGKQFELKNMR
ncbi:MAG: glycoside hydrolase family 5 protein [Verrucomicrobiota bacterium]